MKYLIIVLFSGCICFSSAAQSKIALHAGYNHNSARVFVGNTKQPTSAVPGFNFGARFKTGFEPPLHFVGMLSYTNRGYILKPLQDTIDRIKTSIHYIDIAPMLDFDIAAGSAGNHFSIMAGPSLGIAIGGKQKITSNGQTKSLHI